MGALGLESAVKGTHLGKLSYNVCFSVPPTQNFKREEQNFVIQNEINNLAFLTGDSKSKMSKVSP